MGDKGFKGWESAREGKKGATGPALACPDYPYL